MLYEKNSFSALKDEAILALVNSMEKEYWVVVGIEAHICVLLTAFDLQMLGKNVIVLADCISSRNPEHKRIAIDEMCKKNVRISCIESLLFELLGHAKHSKFKKISNLIR